MPTYFGTCDAAGNTSQSTVDDSTGWMSMWHSGASFVCPGVGLQRVVELSTIVGILSGTPVVRLAIYDAIGNLVCQGAAKVVVVDGYIWQGHMSRDSLTPLNAMLLGGRSYRVGVARDATGILDTYSSGAGTIPLGNVDYDPALDLSGGWPAVIPVGTDYDSYLTSVRVGVEPAPVGGRRTIAPQQRMVA